MIIIDGMTYSLDFRKKVLEIKEEEGLSLDEVSKRFKVGKATIFRWTKRIEPKLTRNKPATKINMKELEKDVKRYPDSYQYERAQRLGVSRGGIWSALKRLKITYKKNLKSPKTR